MRVKEFKDKTDEELLQMADDCFALVESQGGVQQSAHLLKAQFYMNEVDRRHDGKIARRDFKMELWVIALILLEVLIGIGGTIFGIAEGNKQAAILDKMNTSTGATATATQGVNTYSQDQAAKLKTLADEQTKSLGSLEQMNAKLQSSLKQTADMVAAAQEQLKILKEEQANRQAQLAKKPRLELHIGNSQLVATQPGPLDSRELTSTRASYDLHLINLGDATATKGVFRITVEGKNVSLDSRGFQRVQGEPADSPEHIFLIGFDYVRSRVTTPIPITFVYPKGQQTFTVIFSVDADEIPAGTYLGSMAITPPTE
jgi:hypothetical protein